MLVGANAISAICNDFLNIEDSILTSRSSNVEWFKTYGGDRFEMLQCVQTTSDNGYVACGVKSAYDIENPEEEWLRPWVIKTNSNGDLEWEWTTYGFEYESRFFSAYLEVYCMFVEETMDGGFITGFRIYGQSDGDYWISAIVKLNGNGEEEWINFCMDALEWNFGPHSILELNDGSFVLAGFSGTTEIDDMEDFACLYKIDSNGNEQWRKEYNYGEADSLWALCKTSDGGYLITGWADYFDYWMIKTDSNANEEWNKTFGGDSNDFAHARNCYQTADGGYIMAGYSFSFGNGECDTWIVKTDSMGNMDWNRTYGDKRRDVCWSFAQANTNSYVFCVCYNFNYVFDGKADIHLVNIDDKGYINWIQEFGGAGYQIGQHIYKTSDGGFIVSGRTERYGNEASDGLLVKFGEFNNERPNKPYTPSGRKRGQPGTEYTFTTTATDPDGDSLQYMWDWGDGNFSDWLDTNEATYTWTTENNFKIRVKAMDIYGGESEWSDPLAFSTPKNKSFNTPFLQFLENHQHLYPLLRQIFGLQ